MPSFLIRPAVFAADAPRIAEIVGEVWSGGGAAILEAQYGRIGTSSWQHYQACEVLKWMQTPNANAYVVEDREAGGEIIGFCSLQIDHERDTGTVGYNAVAPSHQGKGIGNLMMNHVMEQIRMSGVGYAEVLVADNDAHLPALRVYEKAGFQKVYNLRYMFQKLD